MTDPLENACVVKFRDANGTDRNSIDDCGHSNRNGDARNPGQLWCQTLIPKDEAYRCVGLRVLSEPPAPNQRCPRSLICCRGGLASAPSGSGPAFRLESIKNQLVK